MSGTMEEHNLKKEGYEMKQVRVLSLLLGIAFVVSGMSVCACPAAAQEEYTLQLAGAYPSTGETPRALATEKIKELIEKKSNGKIKVQIYLDNQLGGDREILEGCQLGDIAMVSQTTAPQVGFIPELAIFDIPMLYENLDGRGKRFPGRSGQSSRNGTTGRDSSSSFSNPSITGKPPPANPSIPLPTLAESRSAPWRTNTTWLSGKLWGLILPL